LTHRQLLWHQFLFSRGCPHLFSFAKICEHPHRKSVHGYSWYLVQKSCFEIILPTSTNLEWYANVRAELLDSFREYGVFFNEVGRGLCKLNRSLLSEGKSRFVVLGFLQVLPSLGIFHQAIILLTERGTNHEERQTKDDCAIQHCYSRPLCLQTCLEPDRHSPRL